MGASTSASSLRIVATSPRASTVPDVTREKMTMYGWICLALILVVAWLLRARDFHFSTAFMDESIFVLYGRMVLSHRFEPPLDTPLQWSFGWYLWPAMAATADRLGGLVALRGMAAGLGIVTVAATFGIGRRLFSNSVGLGAALVMAVFAPAVLVSRIATHDAGCIPFFAVGLWAFCRGWKDNSKLHWALAALFFFAAFLCKYLVAIFFPMLVIVAAWKRRKEALIFIAPLFLFSAFYGGFYFHDLQRLLTSQASYASLRAPSEQLWKIYFWDRWDFWLVFVIALPALFIRKWRAAAAFLWVGVVITLLFQWKTKSDYDFWMHINFAMLFLATLDDAVIVTVIDWLRENSPTQIVWRAGAVAALCGAVAWFGQVQNVDRFVFWPNVEPVLAFFEGRLAPGDRVLMDDTVLRYYYNPTLHQYEMTDPMYFHYGDDSGDQAYKAAVHDGVFNYIVLDGGIGEEARRMASAIRPLPENYQLTFAAVDPTRGQKIEVYARQPQPATADTGPSVRLLSPASASMVDANADASGIYVEGMTTGAQPGWYARVEVFTNEWYSQGNYIHIRPDGGFRQKVFLGGAGGQQCYHIIRARVFDAGGNERAHTLNYGITRANPDGSRPSCAFTQ